jgi:hypothetical protein
MGLMRRFVKIVQVLSGVSLPDLLKAVAHLRTTGRQREERVATAHQRCRRKEGGEESAGEDLRAKRRRLDTGETPRHKSSRADRRKQVCLAHARQRSSSSLEFDLVYSLS